MGTFVNQLISGRGQRVVGTAHWYLKKQRSNPRMGGAGTHMCESVGPEHFPIGKYICNNKIIICESAQTW